MKNGLTLSTIFYIIVKQVKLFPYLQQGMLAGIKFGIEAPSLQILPIFRVFQPICKDLNLILEFHEICPPSV